MRSSQKQVYGVKRLVRNPKRCSGFVSYDAEEPGASNLHVIEGEVPESPGYVYDRYLGKQIKISAAELALQEHSKAKHKAYL